MNDRLKRELVVTGIPQIVLPAIRMAVNNHYEMKRLDRQEEMALKVAERRSRGLQAAAGVAGGARTIPTARAGSGDVYDDLEALRSETDCSFCHSVIDSLMATPPAEARAGYDELLSYVREVDRIEGSNISKGEAQQVVSQLVDRWEVIPKHFAGTA